MKKIFGCVSLTAIVLGICATNVQATSGECSVPEGSWTKVCNMTDIHYDKDKNKCELSAVCQHVKHAKGAPVKYSWTPEILKYCSETKKLVLEVNSCSTGTAPSK